MTDTPILSVEKLEKAYTTGWLNRTETFRLKADFTIEEPGIVGLMGPNGSGKTTLFELITGSNRPSGGTVTCCGQNIHRVRASERDRLAIHYHQSYQVRRFARTMPGFLMQRAVSDYPMVHLFDEPQFNTQDGYIGFMLDFFRALRRRGRLVFLCVHPTEPFHLDIMREICEAYMFVNAGEVRQAGTFESLMKTGGVRDYLGALAPSN